MRDYTIEEELFEIHALAIEVAKIIRRDVDLSDSQSADLDACVYAIEKFPSNPPSRQCEFGVSNYGWRGRDEPLHGLIIQVRENGLDVFMAGMVHGDTYVRTGFHLGPEANFPDAEPTVYPAFLFLSEGLQYVLNCDGKGYFGDPSP